MADIAFRVRQYVDWTTAHLSLPALSTVSYYLFALEDPVTHTFVSDPDSYYTTSPPRVVMSLSYSVWEERNGVGVNRGPYAESHEFTHHLEDAFIPSCPGDSNHAGYSNPDSCDSLNEGFAEFLPTYAAQDILGYSTTHVFPNSAALYSSNSIYDSVWDLQSPTYGWGYRSGRAGIRSTEELAIAALFWDLVARNGNNLPAGVVSTNGSVHPVVYSNVVEPMPIGQLWGHLVSVRPNNVWDLRLSFGTPPPTIDLDGDDIPDVAPIDIPFLMHGFYPIDDVQTQFGPGYNFFDLGYAQRHGASLTDYYVGRSDHYQYDSTNTAIKAHLISRSDIPSVPNSNLEITVLDSIGAPLSGATST